MRRLAARVVVLDEVGRVLLFEGHDSTDPAAGTWWFTPGGGLEPGEAPEDGARRELFEETGLQVGELGPVVLERQEAFVFEGQLLEQEEVYYRVQVPAFELDTSGWQEVEARSILRARWWTPEELRTTAAVVYPEGLLDLLAP